MNFTLSAILNKYRTFDLATLATAELENRKDVKFIFNEKELPSVLQHLQAFYSVLAVQNVLLSTYVTTYFDTPNFALYLQHHNEHGNRYKVRIRKYTESNTVFFEEKIKSNTNWTLKERVQLHDENDAIHSLVKYNGTEMVEKKLKVVYKRITLLSFDHTEKITFDIDLQFQNENNISTFENICIAECKSKIHQASYFIQLMKTKGFQETTISKYCLGVNQLFPTIKKNNFKPLHLQLNKLHITCNH